MVMDIQIQRTNIDDWQALDFVNFFYMVRSKHYETEKLNKSDTLHAECMRVKYLMRLFEMYNKTKTDFQTFITWAVDHYVSDSTYILPPQIGYLTAVSRGYLGLPPKQNKKKKKREKIVLPEATQQWIIEQKKKIKADMKQKLKDENAKRRAK